MPPLTLPFEDNKMDRVCFLVFCAGLYLGMALMALMYDGFRDWVIRVRIAKRKKKGNQ